MKQDKMVAQKNSDDYVAYPLGIKGVLAGQGECFEETLSDAKSTIRFIIDSIAAG